MCYFFSHGIEAHFVDQCMFFLRVLACVMSHNNNTGVFMLEKPLLSPFPLCGLTVIYGAGVEQQTGAVNPDQMEPKYNPSPPSGHTREIYAWTQKSSWSTVKHLRSGQE